MNISLEPIWSWWFVIPTIIGLIALVLISYPRRVAHLRLWPRRCLIGLRLAAALALCMAMIRPTLLFSETDTNQALLYVLADSSRSMSIPDGPAGKTRRQVLLETLESTQEQFTELGEQIQLRYADFDQKYSATETLEDKTDGPLSAIGIGLEEVLREARDKRVLATLLLSDGAERITDGMSGAREVARRFGDAQVPIYAVGFGGVGGEGSSLDLAVEDLIVERVVYERNVVPITASIRTIGAAGRDLSVRVLIENRAGLLNGQSGPMVQAAVAPGAKPIQTIRPSRNSEVIPVDLSFVPEMPGEYRLAVEVDVLNGEIKESNNRRETIIQVQKGGIRVAYFDRIRTEVKWIRRLNLDTRIQLDFQPVREGRFREQTKIDEAWLRSGAYDAYIIGDVPASVFGPRGLRLLGQAVDEGAGLIMTGGFHNFGPGGYAGTELSDLLPVIMRRSEIQGTDEIDPTLHYQMELKIKPTLAGLKHFVMQIDPDGNNSERWESLAPLERGSKLREKEGGLVSVLAETADGKPILVAHDVGRARVAAFAGDTTWQWATVNDDLDAHQRFWRQMILWLSHKDINADQALWVRMARKNFTPLEKASFEFGTRDSTGKPIPNVQFEVYVTGPDGAEQKVPVRNNADFSEADFSQTENQGDYWVRVHALKNGQPFTTDAWTRFIVDARDPELDNPAADFALMEELAALSGGDSLPPEQLSERLGLWLTDGIPNMEITRSTRVSLWDNWPFLLIFTGVLTAEWFVRKRSGLV